MEYTNLLRKRFNWSSGAPVDKPYNPAAPNGDKALTRLGIDPGVQVDGADGYQYLLVSRTPALVYEYERRGEIAHQLYQRTTGTDKWFKSDIVIESTKLDDSTFRSLMTGSIVPREEAINDDGELNDYYCTNLEFFCIYYGIALMGVEPMSGIHEYIYRAQIDILNTLVVDEEDSSSSL